MAESMQGLKRTHRCGELTSANIGEKVCPMIRRTRIIGNIIMMIWIWTNKMNVFGIFN